MARASRDIAFCARRGALIALERFFGALGDVECFFGALVGMVFSFSRCSIAHAHRGPCFCHAIPLVRNDVPPHSTHEIALAIKNAAAAANPPISTV
jgi:hypothetical protein